MMAVTGLRFFLLLPVLGQLTADATATCAASFVAMPNQGIADPSNNLPSTATLLDSFLVANADECLASCCSTPECNLAMTEEVNGSKSCYLVNCLFNEVNVCELGPVSDIQSYQKAVGRKPTVADYCTGKPDVGACRATLPMWSYDSTKKSCTIFTYGGCGGNLNTHQSEEDCMAKCKDYKPSDNMSANKRMMEEPSQLDDQAADNNSNPLDRYPLTESREVVMSSEAFNYKDFCTPKSETGPCRAAFPRWYYDPETNTCNRFTYGGCAGNKNNHQAKQDCMDKCSVSPPDPQKLQGESGKSFQEYCAVSKETGPCRAAFPRWYYDPATGSCSKFTYGGCKGNQNNYIKEEDCIKQCVNQADEHENYDPLRPFHHSTTAIALAVLLAVMIAILLGAMVVVFVKVARRNQRDSALAAVWSPIDDKECLMNNAYTL